jgi:hypothetical protein
MLLLAILSLLMVANISNVQGMSEKYYKDHRNQLLICFSGECVGSNKCLFTDNVRVNQSSDRALTMLETAKYTVNSTIHNREMLFCFDPTMCNKYDLDERDQYQVYVTGEPHIHILDIYDQYTDQ